MVKNIFEVVTDEFVIVSETSGVVARVMSIYSEAINNILGVISILAECFIDNKV